MNWISQLPAQSSHSTSKWQWTVTAILLPFWKVMFSPFWPDVSIEAPSQEKGSTNPRAPGSLSSLVVKLQRLALGTNISQGCVILAEEAIQRKGSFRSNSPLWFACLHIWGDLHKATRLRATAQQLSCLQFAERQWRSQLTSLALSLLTARRSG